MSKNNLLQYCTVLCAEDDINLLESITKTLGYFFERVVTAQNGEEAIEMFHQHKPHIVILDIDMPKKNGLEAAEEIRQASPKTPIFFLTIHNEPEKILKGFKLELVDWLIKPISFDSLIETLNRCEKILIQNGVGELKIKDNMSYNTFTKSVFEDGKNICTLTLNESLVLEQLLKKKNQVIPQSELEAILFDYDSSTSSLKNSIYRLRKKMPNIEISCLSKVGYILK